MANFNTGHMGVPLEIKLSNNYRQAQRRAAAARSRHKRYGWIQYQGPYFPPNAQNGLLLFPRFSWEKNKLK